MSNGRSGGGGGRRPFFGGGKAAPSLAQMHRRSIIAIRNSIALYLGARQDRAEPDHGRIDDQETA